MSEKIILDVRTSQEYKKERIKNSIDIPLSFIESRENKVARLLKWKEVIIMCRSWRRAELAKQILLPHSKIDNLKVFPGWIIEYKKQFPDEIITDNSSYWISITRQIQLITGLLIFIFSILGFFINTYFFIWALFVWLWLSIAWFTGFCWLESILKKLPFNK